MAVQYQNPASPDLTLDAEQVSAGVWAEGVILRAGVTDGGCLNHHKVSAATDNATNVKASAGNLHHVKGFNNADYPVYLKFHNTAGTPTAGSGVVLTIGVQAGQRVSESFRAGFYFSTGLAYTIVKDIADAGTTAVAASDCAFDIGYR